MLTPVAKKRLAATVERIKSNHPFFFGNATKPSPRERRLVWGAVAVATFVQVALFLPGAWTTHGTSSNQRELPSIAVTVEQSRLSGAPLPLGLSAPAGGSDFAACTGDGRVRLYAVGEFKTHDRMMKRVDDKSDDADDSDPSFVSTGSQDVVLEREGCDMRVEVTFDWRRTLNLSGFGAGRSLVATTLSNWNATPWDGGAKPAATTVAAH